MNLFNIIDEIEKVDPEFTDRVSPRRDAIKNITSFGSKVAVAAMPFALGTLFQKAYAADNTASVTDVLNYALTLEYLESYFYNASTSTAGLIPAGDMDYILQIAYDENEHVKFLQTVIKSLGATPVTAPKFDLTAGNGSGAGPFKDVCSNYQTFLAVAQAFEDTGVRAYKGQAPALLGNQVVLTAALSIHAVEARHASAIRQLRYKKGVAVTPWITSTLSTGNDTGIALVDGNYAGENNVTQGGVDVTTLPGAKAGEKTSVATATAAFDEPLTMAEVLKLLVGTFIVKQ